MGQSQSSIERQKKIEELKQFPPPIQTRGTYALFLCFF